MEETLFFILGIALTALALIVAAAGLRFESFPPSNGAMAIGIALFSAVVLGTAAFAWLNGEEEQEHRDAEIAAGHELSPQQGLELIVSGEAGEEGEAAEEQPAEEAPAEEPSGAGEAPAEEPAEAPAASAADGAQVFADLGCGGCHTLAAAQSTGTTGPNLDSALKGKDEQYVEAAIVDPNDAVAEGFPPDVMPQTYGDDLSPDQLDALIQYLLEPASGKS